MSKRPFIIKHVFVGLFLLPYSLLFAQTQFLDPYLGVGVHYNLGFTVNDDGDTLRMDVYEPLNEFLEERPVIVWLHGGGFVMGNKNNFPIETLAARFAQMGYVCVSINYSLGFNKGKSDNELAEETVMRAHNELHQALLKLRDLEEIENPYKTNLNILWLGGSSAGAIVAMHYAFLKSEHDSLRYTDIALPENKMEISGVISLSGGIGDLRFLASDIPVLSIHGFEDKIVPYDGGQIHFKFPFLPKVPSADFEGPEAIHKQLSALQYPNWLKTFYGRGHVPFDRILNRNHYQDYMDTCINEIRYFMFSQQKNSNLLPVEYSEHCSQIAVSKAEKSWMFYPVDKNIKKVKLTVYNKENRRVKSAKVRKVLKSFLWEYDTLPEEGQVLLRYGNYSRYIKL